MDVLSQIQWLKVLEHAGRIVVIVILLAVALWLSKTIVLRFRDTLTRRDPGSEQAKRVATLMRVVRSVIGIVIFSVGIMLLMSEVGINLGPLLAAAGIGGLALGFGAQSLVKDVISGFFLLLENQVRVGDVVVIEGTGGLVESVDLRTLTLRDLAGSVHIIPTGSIERVTNMTRDYSCYVFDIGVAYREDPDEVMAILKELGEELRTDPDFGPDILEPLEMFGVSEFADSAVVIKCRIKTKPIKQWRVGREFNRRLKKVFDARGIEIPFPHRTVYMGELKAPAAPRQPRVVADQANGEDSQPATQ